MWSEGEAGLLKNSSPRADGKVIHFWDSQEQGCVFVGFDTLVWRKCPLRFPMSFRELFCDLLLPPPELASDTFLSLHGRADILGKPLSLLPANVYFV